MRVTKIHDLLLSKRTKLNFGDIKVWMIFGPKACTVDNENDQKWSIGTPSQKLRIFQI